MAEGVGLRLRRIGRKRLLVPFGGLAVGLCAASVAWACTPQGGGTASASPNSGGPGTSVTVTVSGGAGYTGVYALQFNDALKVTQGQACHHSTEVIGSGTGTLNGSGINQNGSATIPSTASQGTAQLCYAQGRVGVSSLGLYSPNAVFTVM